MKLTVHEFLTLDGVMQGPGAPDEDRAGGFEHGGWVVPHIDEAFGEIVDSWFADAGAILLGRTTYDLMFPYWSTFEDPDNVVAKTLNGLTKYVVSSTLSEPEWQNTTVISVDEVAGLKEREGGGELQVHGSWRLAKTLHEAGLVDEYRLVVFPVSVGQGKRLFTDAAPPSGFTLADSRVTGKGVVYSALRRAPFEVGAIEPPA